MFRKLHFKCFYMESMALPNLSEKYLMVDLFSSTHLFKNELSKLTYAAVNDSYFNTDLTQC